MAQLDPHGGLDLLADRPWAGSQRLRKAKAKPELLLEAQAIASNPDSSASRSAASSGMARPTPLPTQNLCGMNPNTATL
jgi:hypothetical protein